ncbi:hypothetical protein K435DRAFT_970068 [Dendrothele bispora CBS 962.96]|uniref:Uncharacterized protein n=1 Tax=Dendrothele bispora (strain CBS 962.96) TaxID=1314807 RepID=A0A4S8LDL6_DENBC|nr:hypothetical protein K435DRAFT_970068 [Dendrothele bispora CBS 962.96]
MTVMTSSGRNTVHAKLTSTDKNEDFIFTPKPPSTPTPLLARIEQLSQSNLPPLDSEIPSLSTVLLESKARIKQLGLRISSGRSAHLQKELNNMREKELESINRLKGILSTFRRLPPEILIEIFTFCLQTTLGRFVVDLTPTENMLWRLGQVNSHWRAVVCRHMRRYWSSIVIDMNRLSDQKHYTPESVRYLLETCLSRSGNHCLTFEIIGSPSNNEQLNSGIFDLLVSQSARWKKVTFREISFPLLANSLPKIEQSPVLEDLTICLPKPDTPSIALSNDTMINFFASSPQLQRVYLYGFDLETLNGLHVPWSTLPDISGMYSCDTMLQVFSMATSMDSSYICMGTKTPQDLYTHIIHPSLRDLDLDGYLWILDYLTLPSLQCLCADAWEPSQFSVLPSFLHRHPSIFELRLCIEDGYPDESVMRQVYEACTEITSLNLGVDMHDAYRLFPMLTVDESTSRSASQCLLPRLREIELDAGTVNKDLAELLIKMIDSRSQKPSLNHHCARIESLTIHVSARTLETSLDKQLQVFRDKGMSIVLEESAFPEPTEEEDLVMY